MDTRLNRPAHVRGPADETRDEVTRALLDPDRHDADELGRTGEGGDSSEQVMHASPREQAAAPINIQKVDE